MSSMKTHTHTPACENQEHDPPTAVVPRMACVLAGRSLDCSSLGTGLTDSSAPTQEPCDCSVLRISPGSTAPVPSLCHVGCLASPSCCYSQGVTPCFRFFTSHPRPQGSCDMTHNLVFLFRCCFLGDAITSKLPNLNEFPSSSRSCQVDSRVAF